MLNLRLRRAFTLVEIMLVVVIIGILMAVVVPNMARQSGRAKVKAARSSIHGISTALGVFEVKASRFPTTQEGLQALVTKPQDLSDDEWEGPYLKEFPKDPWGQDFIYKSPGDVNKDFDLISKGPDKAENTPDDINNFPKTTEGQP
jgi:general secretion pathway protein G